MTKRAIFVGNIIVGTLAAVVFCFALAHGSYGFAAVDGGLVGINAVLAVINS